MPIPAELKRTVDQEIAAYCERKVPLRVRDKVWLVHQWRGCRVTLVLYFYLGGRALEAEGLVV